MGKDDCVVETKIKVQIKELWQVPGGCKKHVEFNLCNRNGDKGMIMDVQVVRGGAVFLESLVIL